jgi:hypothetical protein
VAVLLLMLAISPFTALLSTAAIPFAAASPTHSAAALLKDKVGADADVLGAAVLVLLPSFTQVAAAAPSRSFRQPTRLPLQHKVLRI